MLRVLELRQHQRLLLSEGATVTRTLLAGAKIFDGTGSAPAEADVVIAIHAADSGYAKYIHDWGESERYTGLKLSPRKFRRCHRLPIVFHYYAARQKTSRLQEFRERAGQLALGPLSIGDDERRVHVNAASQSFQTGS